MRPAGSSVLKPPAAPPRQARPTPTLSPAPAPRRRPIARPVLAALAAAWLVPLAAQAAGLDALLPPLLVLAVAALLRSGRLLDRLVVALILMLGAACAAGLVLSVWPWHLAPVPVAGTAGTGLVLIAALLRRRPSLPRALPAPDLVVLAFTGLALASVVWPFRGLDAGGRLGVVAAGGDLANHFALVDAVRSVGGYVFLHPHAPGAGLIWAGLLTYPQGLHLVTGLLMNFLSGGTAPGQPVHEIDTFLWFQPAMFVLLCLCVLWSVRRLAGPGTRGLALLPVAGLGTAYLIWSDPLMIMWNGFWSELGGLAAFAVLVGVLVRPLHRTREQVMVVAAALVAICFTYFLLLPAAVVLVGAWLLWYRRRLRPLRAYTMVVLSVAAAAGSVMVVVPLVAVDLRTRMLSGGAVYPVDLPLLAALGLLALGGVAVAARRRSAAWRMTALLPVAACGLVAAIMAYQMVGVGMPRYYGYKALHLLMVVFVIGLAPLARLVPRRGPRQVMAPLLALAALVSLGPLGQFGVGRLYLDRTLAWEWVGRAALQVAATVPARAGTVTVIWGGRRRSYAAQTSQWADVMWRTGAVSWRGHMWVAGQPQRALPSDEVVTFVEMTSVHYRVRFVTDDPTLLAVLRVLREQRPDLPLEIVDVPLPP
jgi:hypothetical protein